MIFIDYEVEDIVELGEDVDLETFDRGVHNGNNDKGASNDNNRAGPSNDNGEGNEDDWLHRGHIMF